MINRILLLVAWVGFVLVLSLPVQAQDGVKYREFPLGGNLASITRLAGVSPSEAKVVHQRPALLQDLEWRPRYVSRGPAAVTDPVDFMVFSFYNDQLYRVVVNYDARRTEGLTQADIVATISATYGVASIPIAKARPEARYGDPDMVLATWGNTEYALTLLRVSSQNAFKLIVSSTRLAELARVAGLESVRLDAVEAPQREIARERQEAEDARTADEKAKQVNLPAFRP